VVSNHGAPVTKQHDAVLASERGETNNMKYLAILTAIAALGLGACAKKEQPMSTSSQTATTSSSYAK
jgi:hypothetical protein